ncbi:Fe(3+)-transport system permease sfuB [Klebsiella pneumoniae subsp. pneumoniae WGLW2]|nr:Fe(3+)-transport system permease sfuB [Klebsiella pneumoniae subsp. pneumoniae WGLW2]
MIRFDTFTTAIYDQFQSTFSGPAANMLAGVLALCCLAILLLESAYAVKRVTRVSAPGRPASRSGLCWVKGPLLARSYCFCCW